MERPVGNVAVAAAISFSGTRRNYRGPDRRGTKVRGHSPVLVPKCCCTDHNSMRLRTVTVIQPVLTASSFLMLSANAVPQTMHNFAMVSSRNRLAWSVMTSQPGNYGNRQICQAGYHATVTGNRSVTTGNHGNKVWHTPHTVLHNLDSTLNLRAVCGLQPLVWATRIIYNSAGIVCHIPNSLECLAPL
jgi:hypothetical protein